MVSPGGEGKIELKVNLKGFHGKVQKSATVFSNDPQNTRLTLRIKGKVRTLIEVSPSTSVFFQGQADKIGQKSIDIATESKPFHITKLESDLGEKIAYDLETVKDGKQYRLNVKNHLDEGTYRGYIKLYTDMGQKPEILIRVVGNIEGVISVRPQSIVVGKLAPNQPVRSGKVLVINNRDEPFKITHMSYDTDLLTVSQQPLPKERTGYSLEITPKLEKSPDVQKADQRQELKLVIETSVEPHEKKEVKVYLIKR